jgi:hypothetical protein
MLVMGLGVLFWWGIVQARQRHHESRHGEGGGFSNASLQGNYVVSFYGWVSGTVASASLGRQNGLLLIADGQVISLGPKPPTRCTTPTGFRPPCQLVKTVPPPGVTLFAPTINLTGTYSVNSDGTGTTPVTATPAARGDCRCGSSSGFTTAGSWVAAPVRSNPQIGQCLKTVSRTNAARRTCHQFVKRKYAEQSNASIPVCSRCGSPHR